MKLTVQEYVKIRDELEKTFKDASESLTSRAVRIFEIEGVMYKIHAAPSQGDNSLVIRILKKENNDLKT